jgi:hypothetical protein
MGRLISPMSPIGLIRIWAQLAALPKRDQFPPANLARFLAGFGRGEPEGCDCGLGVGLLLGLFIAIN